MSLDFENLIKAESANCTAGLSARLVEALRAVLCHQDTLGNECGTFWIYDLDDIEDSSADGVSTPADFDASPWKYQQDVSILLLNLEEVGHSGSQHAMVTLHMDISDTFRPLGTTTSTVMQRTMKMTVQDLRSTACSCFQPCPRSAAKANGADMERGYRFRSEQDGLQYRCSGKSSGVHPKSARKHCYAG